MNIAAVIVLGLAAIAALCAACIAAYQLRRSSPAYAELQSRIDKAPLPMLIVDNGGRILRANSLLAHLFGYEPGELQGQPLELLVPLKSREVHARLREAYAAQPIPRPMSKRDLYGLHRDGRLIPVEVGLSVADYGSEFKVLATVTDISERKRHERELDNANAFMSAIIDSMPFSVITTDIEGTITAMSPVAEQLLGYRREELVGRCTPALLHDPSEMNERAWELRQALDEPIVAGFDVFVAMARRGEPESRLWTYVRKDGSRVPVQLTVSAILDPQRQIAGFLGIAYDATEQRRRDEHLSQLAFYDSLTGLPNRTLLKERVTQALQRAQRLHRRMALMLVDLDHFKHVNDSLGHAAGDQLLIAVAARLQNCVRASDTVARLGGDEFVAILADIHDADQIHAVARHVLESISSPVSYQNQTFQVTPSIGISFFPDNGNDLDTLLQHADQAMYLVKNEGRAGARLFGQDPEDSRGADCG